MTLSIAFTLAGHPPSPNATLRQHFMAKARDRAAWRTTARAAALLAIRDAGIADDLPWPRVRVRLVWILPDRRRRDPDNAVSSVKSCLDGVVDSGLITDDSFAVIVDLAVSSEPGPRKALRIEVTEA